MTALLLMSAALAVSADAPAAAFALEVRGTVTVDRAGKVIELEDGDPIREGDKLTVKADGGVSVYFRPSGPVAVLNGPAEAKVLPGKLDTTAAVAVRDVKLPPRAADGLNRDVKADLIGGLTLRAFEADKPSLAIRPVAWRAVASVTPEFAWPAADGATGYRVELDEIGKSNMRRKVWEAVATSNRLTYPEGKRALSRDPKSNTYAWRVTPLVPDGTEKPVVESRFFVLTEPEAANLAEVAALEKSGEVADWIVAAEAYSGLGLTDEPIKLLQKVAEKRPGSAWVWAELARHYAAAGLSAEQKKAQAEADRLSSKK